LLKTKKLKGKYLSGTTKIKDPLASLLHFHYGTDAEPANEPVDPGTEWNQTGPSSQEIYECLPH